MTKGDLMNLLEFLNVPPALTQLFKVCDDLRIYSIRGSLLIDRPLVVIAISGDDRFIYNLV